MSMRSRGAMRDQTPERKALRADLTAASTSPASLRATSQITVLSTGLIDSNLRPFLASTNLPSIRLRVSGFNLSATLCQPLRSSALACSRFMLSSRDFRGYPFRRAGAAGFLRTNVFCCYLYSIAAAMPASRRLWPGGSRWPDLGVGETASLLAGSAGERHPLKLAVVIAAYDEFENIRPLCGRLLATLRGQPAVTFELIFVVEGNDG